MPELTALGERIKKLMDAQGIKSQRELSHRAGVSPGYVSQIMTGRLKGYGVKFEMVAKVLRISAQELRGTPFAHTSIRNADVLSEGYRDEMPLKGYVAAGIPREVYELDMGTVKVQLPPGIRQWPPHAFALIISGDSLKDDEINHGDLVVVDPDAPLQVGRLYVVRINNEFCARHVYTEEDGTVRLKAANSHYEDIRLMECNVVGRVIAASRTWGM